MIREKRDPKANRKGVSIAEMCVVLAIVSIVALTVVSFTTMVSAQSRASATKYNAMEDMELTEAILEDWVDIMLEKNTSSITPGEGSLTARVGAADYSIFVQELQLVAQLPGEVSRTFPLKTVKELRFDTMENTDCALYFCTVVYEVPSYTGEGVERTFTFCIQPRIGEVLN